MKIIDDQLKQHPFSECRVVSSNSLYVPVRWLSRWGTRVLSQCPLSLTNLLVSMSPSVSLSSMLCNGAQNTKLKQIDLKDLKVLIGQLSGSSCEFTFCPRLPPAQQATSPEQLKIAPVYSSDTFYTILHHLHHFTLFYTILHYSSLFCTILHHYRPFSTSLQSVTHSTLPPGSKSPHTSDILNRVIREKPFNVCFNNIWSLFAKK